MSYKILFDVIEMLQFRETKVRYEKIHAAKKPIIIWDVNIASTVISKLFKTKANSKCLIGYLDKLIRPLVLIMPKMSEYVKASKVEDKNSKLMSFCINDEKLLEKYKAIWTKIEDLKIFN